MTEELQRIRIAEALNHQFTRTDVCAYCNGSTPYEAGDDYGITIWAECKTCNNTGKAEPYYVGLPDYPQSHVSSIALIDFLEKRGYACVMVAQHGKRCCTFTTTGRPDFKAISDTFPKAICKSFLAVLGLWEQ